MKKSRPMEYIQHKQFQSQSNQFNYADIEMEPPLGEIETIELEGQLFQSQETILNLLSEEGKKLYREADALTARG